MTVAFSWNGLPQYAARLIRGAARRLGDDCVVVGSRPSVPIRGMEEILETRIHWVDADAPATWRGLGLDVPKFFVQSGWGYPAFNALGAEVKARQGHVIGLSDNNWRGDFRQIVLGAAAYRLLHRRRFDAMIVPGRQGKRLMRWFGAPARRTRAGMLGADPELFNGGEALPLRPKTFLFVGQFIPRKDVLRLARAFIRFSQLRPDWTLRLCGSGEQRGLIPSHPNIAVEEFVQPEQLVEYFRQARFFVLPSLIEAWGVVTHEAACCGCALVLSDRIASADDLSTRVNALRFRAGDEDELLRALLEAAAFDDARLLAAEAESRQLARAFGPERFGAVVADLVAELAHDVSG
jgi:glycosyltransferase involved in cell wall biosynthesis